MKRTGSRADASSRTRRHRSVGAFDRAGLRRESAPHDGTAGSSAGNRSQGFRPGFIDTDTGIVYDAQFADGRPAPFHLLDGLPESVVVARDQRGRVHAVKATIVPGFIRQGAFFTRAEAAAAAVTAG
ncbi:MAG: hypothetical protein ACKVQT_35715 [Burkholderiales bacterium]